MRKPFQALARLGIGATAALALVFGGLAAPALADDEPVETPAAEVVETPAETPVEPVADPEPAEEPVPVEERDTEEDVIAPAVVALDTLSPSVTAQLSDDESTVTITGLLPATRTGVTPPNAGVAIPTGVYLMWCVEPAAGTRASGAACDASKQQWIVASPVTGGTVVGSVADGWWSFEVSMAAAETFGTHECLADGPEQCGVYVRPDHRFGSAVTDLDGFSPITFAATPAPTPSVTALLSDDESTVTVTGFLPATRAGVTPPNAGVAIPMGVYLMWCVEPAAGTRASGAACDASKQQWIVASAVTGGTVVGSVSDGWWSFEVAMPAAETFGTHECLADGAEQCGVYVRPDHRFGSAVTDLDGFDPITFAATPTPSVTAVLSGDESTVTVTGLLPATRTGVTPPNAGVAIPTGVYLMWCVEPAAGTRASGTACDASKQQWIVASAVTGGTVVGSVADGWWSFEVSMAAAETFGTHECLADGPEQCGVYVRPDHRFGSAVTDLDGFSPITFAATPVATATTTVLTASATAVTEGSSITLSAAVAPTSAAGQVRFTDGASIVGTVPVSAGAATLAVAPGVGAHGFQAQFLPTDPAAYSGSLSAIVGVQVDAAPAPALASGSLHWAVRDSFNQYILTTAAGTISVAGGASGSAAGFRFPQSGGDWSGQTQTGTVAFAGSVRYTGHAGALDLTLGSPRIVVHDGSSATLYLNGIAFASLALSSGSKSVGEGGAVTWSSVPATLTAAGASVFQGFYSAGEALSPVTFTAGAAAAGTGGGTVVVAAAAATKARTPAPTAPATTGAEVAGELVPGGEVTLEADGFEPDEQGILVVVYSTPVLLGTVDADANGIARWTGRLPADLTGKHTLTLQGSVNRGVELEIGPAVRTLALAAGQCTVEDATLAWGFKESFRAYLTSSIANGEWATADGASYETPEFSWPGDGSLDPDAETGDIAFSGSVRFTGHDGVLDTRIANPRIVIDGENAVLRLDVTGTTQDGTPVEAMGVEFATLDLSAGASEAEDGVVVLSGIPATLTAAGAEAFGTYPEGEALDPVTLTAELPADCDEAAAPTPEVTATAIDAPMTAGPDLTWLWWLLGALVLAGVIVAIVLAVRPRRPTT